MVIFYHSTILARSTSMERTADGYSEVVLRCLQYGTLGVPMFFVVSGYCITAAALNAQQRNTPIHVYFWRRFRRIYPPYWIILGLLIPMFFVFDVFASPGCLSSAPWAQFRPWWFTADQWLGNITLTETWRSNLGGAPRGHILGQSWTLCYEEQFYLVVGLLLLLPARAFFVSCVMVTVACLLAQQFAHSHGIGVAGFFFDGQWLSFAFGVAVFFAANRLGVAGRVATVLALAAAAMILPRLPGLDQHCLAFSSSFAVLLILLHPWDEPIRNMRSCPPALKMWSDVLQSLPGASDHRCLHFAHLSLCRMHLALDKHRHRPATLSSCGTAGWLEFLSARGTSISEFPSGAGTIIGLRVVITTWAPFHAGAEVAAERLAVGLRDHGYDVTVVLGTKGVTLDRIRDAGFDVRYVSLAFTDKLRWWRYRRAQRELRHVLRDVRPDIVHANDLPTSQMVGQAAAALGIPRICHHRWVFGGTATDWLNKFGAERHLFVSRALMDDLCKSSHRLAASPRAVVYDGLELPSVPTDADRRNARTKLGLPLDKTVVLFAGQIIERKGVEDLLRAWTVLSVDGPRTGRFNFGGRRFGKRRSVPPADGRPGDGASLPGAVCGPTARRVPMADGSRCLRGTITCGATRQRDLGGDGSRPARDWVERRRHTGDDCRR